MRDHSAETGAVSRDRVVDFQDLHQNMQRTVEYLGPASRVQP